MLIKDYSSFIGKPFGKLLLKKIYKVPRRNRFIPMGLCDCLCGNTNIEVTMYNLITGNSTSCGCSRGESRAVYANDEYIGKVFNNLLVKGITRKEGTTGVYWECSCLKCNRPDPILLKACGVLKGKIKDCGCTLLERNTKYKDKSLIGTKINGNTLLDIVDVPGEKTYWVCECQFCNTVFIGDASHTATGHRKSCGCLGASFGEKCIAKILTDLQFKYKQEFVFDGLKGNANSLRYDFAILDKDFMVLALIEFDGLQHSKIEYQRGCATLEEAEQQLLLIQKYDSLKDAYAKDYKLPLLRIPYTRKYEDIQKQVLAFLIELNIN